MADPPRCPACGSEPPADPHAPCPTCGHLPEDALPFADEIPERAVAIPVRPPRPRPEPLSLVTETEAARGIRWLVITAGLMVIGSCLFLGLLTGPAQRNGGLNEWLFGPQWREYAFEKGGFRVELPAAPRDDMAWHAKVVLTPRDHIEGTTLDRHGEDYSVVYTDIPPPGRRVGDEEVLRLGAVGATRTTPEGRVVREGAVEVSGLPGREVVVEYPGAGVVVLRMVVAETRVYSAAVGGPPDLSAADPRVRRFLDAFAVTDPNLLARVPRR